MDMQQMADAMMEEMLKPEFVKLLDERIPQGRSPEFYDGCGLGMMLCEMLGQGVDRQTQLGSKLMVACYLHKKVKEAGERAEEWPNELGEGVEDAG